MSFTLVGVIDLLGGQAVHARGGRRDQYQPVEPGAGAGFERGDALGLAAFYVDGVGLDDLYVADLDAIAGGAGHRELIPRLAGTAPNLWLDAGITTPGKAGLARTLGATHLVVGLETLPSYEALAAIVATAAGTAVVLSLDLRDGVTITTGDAIPPGTRAEEVAVRAVDSGVATIIVLDLARVGSAAGCDLDTIARIRRAVPHIRLLAGGGVRGTEDLRRLADAGCDGALAATALIAGTLRRLS